VRFFWIPRISSARIRAKTTASRIEREDTREDYGEPRFVATGIVADVGIITVVWTPRGRRRHIITAWRASKSEKEEYYANCAGFQGADPPSWRPG
jgi:uncharacterized DUF497 family protein